MCIRWLYKYIQPMYSQVIKFTNMLHDGCLIFIVHHFVILISKVIHICQENAKKNQQRSVSFI